MLRNRLPSSATALMCVVLSLTLAGCLSGGGGGAGVFIPATFDTGGDTASSSGVSDTTGTGNSDAASSGGTSSGGTSSGGTSSGGDAGTSGGTSGGTDAGCPDCCKGAADCDDNDSCTTDTCDVGAGQCKNTKISGCGELSAPCSKAAPCVKGVCDPETNACVSCVSSKDCSANQLCHGKACIPAKACQSDVDCKATNQVCAKSENVCVGCLADADCPDKSACLDFKCTFAPACKSSKECAKVCNTALGKCVECAGSEDCGDNKFCTKWGKCAPAICSADACAGKALFECREDGGGFNTRPDCDDDNVCSDDGCSNDKGCIASNNAAKCDDGDVCTTNDGCGGGKCTGGASKCDDNNPCTDDKCHPDSGCYHTANSAPCDDNNKCTTSDGCSGGACSGKTKTSADCSDNNDCTTDACDPKSGCTNKFNEKSCDDGNKCTDTDKCLAGKCTGQSTKCDDGNKCTTDGCDKQGGCTHTNNNAQCDDGKKCTEDDSCAGGACLGGKKKLCNDDNPCTIDSCDETSGCVHKNTTSTTYCNDGNACTKTDKCAFGKCAGSTFYCNDSKVCTSDTCDKVTGCKYTPKTGACTDSNQCTVGDACSNGLCKAGTQTLPCDDKNACTTDSCDKFKGCQYADNSGKCNDLDPCTTDNCDAATGKCSHTAIAGCCKDHVTCDDKKADTADKCAGNKCYSIGSSACTTDAACNDGDACTVDSCVPGADGKPNSCSNKADATKCTTAPLEYTFEKDLQGWTADAKTSKSIEWSHTGNTDAADKGVAHFGLQNGVLLSSVSCANYGYLISPEIKLAPGQAWSLNLTFKIDLTAGSSSYNKLYFYAENDKKSTLIGSASYSSSLKAWQTKTYDVSPLAGVPFKLKLRGWLGNYSCTSSSSRASGLGVQVDKVAFTSDGKAKPCKTDSECDGKFGCLAPICAAGSCSYKHLCCTSSSQCSDDRACTTDSCYSAKCKWTTASNCCSTDKECDDGKACTLDLCQAGKCAHPKLAGCCESNGDCDDKDDKCTADTCDTKTGQCSYAKLCCADAKDCDDKDDKCTTDTCSATTGLCEHKQTRAAGCCSPTLWSHNFDGGTPTGITFSNKYGATKGWQVWNEAPLYKSPKGVMYYGNPAAKNYNFGSSYGTATFPEVQLPNATGLELRFWARFDKETSSSYDKMSLRIQPSGGSIKTLWTTNTSDKDDIWYDKKFNLDAYKGQKIKVVFYFTTVDSSSNSEMGVFIDDVQLTQTCK